MYADYRSRDGKVVTHKKKYGEDFPAEIEVNGITYYRHFSAPTISVAEGLAGNAGNGYSGSIDGVYRPSPLTPLNKVYGKTGRIGGVESHHGD